MKLDLLKYRVEHKRYSQLRAIMAELGESDTLLLRALRDGHGIQFDSVKDDPELYFTVDSQQTDGLKQGGVSNPTWMQLAGSSRCWAFTESECKRRFKAMVGMITPEDN